MTPGDYDSVNENIVVDLPFGGTTRRLIVHPLPQCDAVRERGNGLILGFDAVQRSRCWH
jgi:hypothetical protein